MRVQVGNTRLRDGGFSFIELLAYMAIAALLILAAIPQFNNYRGAARDASTMSDVKNVSVAMEAWAINHPGEVFPNINIRWASFPDTGSSTLSDLGVTISDGTRLAVRERSTWTSSLPTVFSSPGAAYCVFAVNDNGAQYRDGATAQRLTYHSGNGGMRVPCESK